MLVYYNQHLSCEIIIEGHDTLQKHNLEIYRNIKIHKVFNVTYNIYYAKHDICPIEIFRVIHSYQQATCKHIYYVTKLN